MIPSGYYKVFNARDRDGFLYHTLQAFALFVAISVVSTVIKEVSLASVEDHLVVYL